MDEKPAYWLDASRKAAIGQRIKQRIKTNGITQADVARQLGVTRAQVSLICKNGGAIIEVMAEIARILGESLDYLVLGRMPKADPEFQQTLGKLMKYLSPEELQNATKFPD